MDKLSDRLDRIDKAMDLRNYYIDNQKHAISQEIHWLADNENNPKNLRLYCANFLCKERIIRIGDKGLSQLAEIRGNNLCSQFRRLEQQKMDNRPLKFIVWELKGFGQ